MHHMTQFAKQLLVACLLLFLPVTSLAQVNECAQGSTCVEKEDLETLLDALQEKRCLLSEKPQLELDSVTIVTDEEGRVYYSGAAPQPYRAHLHWCNYDAAFEGTLNVVVAKREPKVWGFRFRLKFAGSFFFLDAFERSAQEAIDVGLLWDFFHWRDLNLNLATGFRSVGAGVGYDITKNFGAYGGYGFSFWTLRSNPQVGIYFGFW